MKLTLKDLDLKGKRVLMRVDFNVPIKEGNVVDDTRIREALPSIRYVLEKGGSLVLMSHLGRPEGKDLKYTLKPCAEKLSELLRVKVHFGNDVCAPITLLENLRFNEAEEKPEKDPEFAKNLAKLGDVYVNDAFGTAHRKHASTYDVARYFEGKAAMGLLMEKELSFLGKLLAHPERPFYGIVGGAKASTKLGAIKSLLKKVDALFVGGKMANDKEIIELSKTNKIFLPVDDNQGRDIGPKTIKEWSLKLSDAKTIFWNGPVGVFEEEEFAKGTCSLAKALSELNATTIAAGGDTLAAINQFHLGPKFTYLSTGGGATLEFFEFGHLPGIDILSNKE